MNRRFTILYNIYKNDFINSLHIFKRFIFLVLASLTIGLLNGVIGSLFKILIKYATQTRINTPQLILCMPLVAMFTYLLYKLFHKENSKGTNLVLQSVRTDDNIGYTTAPLMFVSTVLSHLTGASVGCEGAALQIGGGVGQSLSRIAKFDIKDKHILTMCGMSACFSALFGTPIAAAVFVIEVISIGVMYYSALIPCVISAMTARHISYLFGIEVEIKSVNFVNNFEVTMYLKVLLLACGCAFVSILFCRMLKLSEKFSEKIENNYLRALILSIVAVVIIFIFGKDSFAGTGMNVINTALSGESEWYFFLIKMILTSICVCAGLKGGEIVPTFFIGSTFGCVVGALIGIPADFAAAIGLLAVFCGVTNCPLATLLIGFELFGAQNAVYLLLAISVSYYMSGYHGLYNTQKIVYSKYSPEFINIRAK